MSWWLWIAYGALCAGICLFPSRFNLLVAQQSMIRGRKQGIISALGAAFGITLSMTLASLILIGYLSLIGPVTAFLGWVGVSWLILSALWIVGTVPFRSAMPDNDNLKSKSPLSAFVETLSAHLTGLRFLGFFLAVIAQFCIAPNALTISDFIDLKIATFALSFICLLLIAFTPTISINWLKGYGLKIAQMRPRNRTLIAAKAVKARYRKMAA